MSGAFDRHATIALALASLIRTHLRGLPCRVFIADMKLRIEASDAFFYPDIFVTCAESDRSRAYFKQSATLIVEVLSPSTAAYNRVGADLFRRNAEGQWVLFPSVSEEQVGLASIGLTFALDGLYEDVDLDVQPE